MFIEFSRPLVVTVVSAMIAIVDSRVGGGGGSWIQRIGKPMPINGRLGPAQNDFAVGVRPELCCVPAYEHENPKSTRHATL